MSDFTGDMTSAVEAAFAASSTPEPASTPAVETPAPSASETATPDVSQQAAAQSETTTTEPGPIPYTRFKEVNEKAQAASKELEALAWAKGLDPAIVQEFARVQQIARTNPLVWTEQLEAVRDHPVLGPQLRSWAARTLGFRNASRPTETVEDTMPEPDLHFEDGRKAYSAEAQAKRDQFLLRQFESKLDERINPLAEKGKQVDQIVAEKEYARIAAQAEVNAKTEIDSLREQYPQFKEHEKDVAAVMEANPRFTLEQAWAQVFVKQVGPKLAGQHAASVNRKVQAGTGGSNPARPSAANTPKPAEGFKEALEMAFGVTTNG
jgi:hypothetical protein